MQIQAGTVREAGMSDQPIDPLGEIARTCLRMEMASPKVAECQKIVERLKSAKVRIMPATAGQVRPGAGFMPGASAAHHDERGDGDKYALQHAEHQKVEREAMPQADDQHVQHDAEDKPDLAEPAQRHRERRKQIVRDPTGQAHVPSAPEFLNVDGRERRVEVGRALDSEQLADAERDIRVASEVGVKLQQIAARQSSA